MKKTQIRDAELSLSELQHRRQVTHRVCTSCQHTVDRGVTDIHTFMICFCLSQHALQELGQIVAEREKIGKESMTLAFYLKGGRTGKDSARYKNQKV